MLKKDDTFSTETTGEEDEDGTGLKAGPGLGRVDTLTNLLRNLLLAVMVSTRAARQ